MVLISCPYCGPREETEFRYGDEGVPIPEDANDRDWARFLYYRSSPAGLFTERWVHTHGCRRWFFVVRDTLTHEIASSRTLESPQPERSAERGATAPGVGPRRIDGGSS